MFSTRSGSTRTGYLMARVCCSVLLAPVSMNTSAWAAELGTAFTYQGFLENPPGTPVNDTCLFDLRLCDDPSAPCAPGTQSSHPGIAVSGGIFTVPNVDFGVNAFNGTARWIEVQVGCGAGTCVGGTQHGLPCPPNPCAGAGATCSLTMTTLSPRVKLTPAPHALALPGFYTKESGSTPNLIGGHDGNSVDPGVVGATISGGGLSAPNNHLVTDNFGTIGGGQHNQAGDAAGNTSDRPWATVGGGVNNIASGQTSTIGGGQANRTLAIYSTIGGGDTNTASGTHATVAGGVSNTSNASQAAVGGGWNNVASAISSTVAGGTLNTASGQNSSVGGGYDNTASQFYSTVGGGWRNVAGKACIGGGNVGNPCQSDGDCSPGGTCSTSTPDFSTVAGGGLNVARGSNAVVGGGQQNTASGSSAVVAGGFGNTASGISSVVAGGTTNRAEGFSDTVGGGETNLASGGNTGTAGHATVAGGESNEATADYASIGGGFDNTASNSFATIGGGQGNLANQPNATVAGGSGNNSLNQYATVSGGQGNIANGQFATICGGGGPDATTRNGASGDWSTVAGGQGNFAGGDYSFAGGRSANANHDGSFVWADSTTSTDFDSTANNQFLIRAAGGVGIGTNNVDSKLVVSGSDSTSHGKGAAIKITNTAAGGGSWYLRAGATGTTTPPGGFSIANDSGYWLTIDSTGSIDIGLETVQVDSGDSAEVAVCPAGKRLIGGGCDCYDDLVEASRPSPPGGVVWPENGWLCICSDAGTTTAFAICARVK